MQADSGGAAREVRDAGCWLLAVGYWLLANGYWLLATGCWLLAASYWLLAAGCWLLAVGYYCWLLADRQKEKPTQSHVHRTHGYHMGGTAMMASVILLMPKHVRTEVWLRPAVDHRGCNP